MKKRLFILLFSTLQILLLESCDPGSVDDNAIATDSLTIAAGEVLFHNACSGCHNFRQDGIGPQLAGLTDEVSPKWIHDFIKNSQQLISAGDTRAVQLYQKYKVVMPSFQTMKETEVEAIIAFMNTKKDATAKRKKKKGNELINPIPDTIANSNLLLNLQLVKQIPASNTKGKGPQTRINKLSFQPKGKDLFILDLRGKLYRLRDKRLQVYMDMAKLKPNFINEPGLATGFGSFAFHPDFENNGLLYTTHTEPPGAGKADFQYSDSIKVTLQWVLTEWKTSNPRENMFSGTSREMFRVNMVSGIHGVQEITFNPFSKPQDEDYGLLYIGVGDGGSVELGYPFLVHTIERVWGTILRVDPVGRNSINGHYGIPASNPFAEKDRNKYRGEIYAYGFRNPHRMTWTKSGKLLVSNIGQAHIESINEIQPGHNYGWPIREGTFVIDSDGDINNLYPLPSNDNTYGVTYPVAQYDHDEGKAVSAGYEYTGKNIPQLSGKYIFGDIPTGRLFFIDLTEISHDRQALIKEFKVSFKGTTRTLRQICGNDRVDLHFGKDSEGELYILTKADGKVYKIKSASIQR
jgi:glucose/arabinose dehydrogenase/mono/diheme cytochrome c family protein